MKMLLIVAALASPSLALSQEWNQADCTSALEHAYNPFLARSEAHTTGDFNSDGRADFAVLLDRQGAPSRSAIGVCLSNEARPLLIISPFQTGKIFTKIKGTAYQDSETGVEGTYDRDVISVSDGAWIGASYLLRAGVFVRIVDGD